MVASVLVVLGFGVVAVATALFVLKLFRIVG